MKKKKKKKKKTPATAFISPSFQPFRPVKVHVGVGIGLPGDQRRDVVLRIRVPLLDAAPRLLGTLPKGIDMGPKPWKTP